MDDALGGSAYEAGEREAPCQYLDGTLDDAGIDVTVLATRPGGVRGDGGAVSFDLAVLAMDASADAAAARVMFGECSTLNHPEGELDERIAAFYAELRARFPDYPPYDESTPWMDMPLSTGIDHVIMHLSFSARSDPALRAIMELAEKHRLVVYDPQSSDAVMPGQPPGNGNDRRAAWGGG